MRTWMLTAILGLAAGCATTGKSPLQTLSVSTANEKGEPVVGVMCTLRNDKGQWDVTTPGHVDVVRSRGALQVDCANDEWRSASKVDSSVAAAVLKGAGEGAAIGGVVGLVGVATSGGAAGGSLAAAATAGSFVGLTIVVMAGVGLLSHLGNDAKRSYPTKVVVIVEPRTPSEQ